MNPLVKSYFVSPAPHIANYSMHKTLLLTLITSCCLLLCCCGKPPIRHLNSDVALVPIGASQSEVIAIWGQPTQKQIKEESEQWLYVEAKKSLLKRIWLINLIAGTTSYEIIQVTFVNGSIAKSSFRYATAEEFKQSGLTANPKVNPDEF